MTSNENKFIHNQTKYAKLVNDNPFIAVYLTLNRNLARYDESTDIGLHQDDCHAKFIRYPDWSLVKREKTTLYFRMLHLPGCTCLYHAVFITWDKRQWVYKEVFVNVYCIIIKLIPFKYCLNTRKQILGNIFEKKTLLVFSLCMY